MIGQNAYHMYFVKSYFKCLKRLSSHELLPSCAKDLTQNQNESLKNVVWTKCTKRVFIGLSRFKLAVCEAITTFNDGTKCRENLHHQLNVECCYSAKKALSIQNNIRLRWQYTLKIHEFSQNIENFENTSILC